MSEELEKAISLLELIKARIVQHHERETYFTTLMVIDTLPEISRLLRELKP